MIGFDSQQVEVIGRSLLIVALTRDGLEVARPERDNGMDRMHRRMSELQDRPRLDWRPRSRCSSR